MTGIVQSVLVFPKGVYVSSLVAILFSGDILYLLAVSNVLGPIRGFDHITTGCFLQTSFRSKAGKLRNDQSECGGK